MQMAASGCALWICLPQCLPPDSVCSFPRPRSLADSVFDQHQFRFRHHWLAAVRLRWCKVSISSRQQMRRTTRRGRLPLNSALAAAECADLPVVRLWCVLHCLPGLSCFSAQTPTASAAPSGPSTASSSETSSASPTASGSVTASSPETASSVSMSAPSVRAHWDVFP